MEQPSSSPLSNEYVPLFSQRIESITDIPYIPARRPPSTLKALFALANALNTKEIGHHGPVLAATSAEQNQQVAELGLYQEVYPRDAYVTARLLWDDYPSLTKATILACLPYTGTQNTLSSTEWIDEQEVGKIPHQIRSPEHPRSKRQFELRKRGYPYYGAIDTTQKSILAIVRQCSHDPDFLHERYQDIHGETHSVFEAFETHVDWILERTSLNPEGLVESLHINPRHHANQSWVDSPDSFHHADGRLARHHPEHNWGVASVEVNAETYDALIASIRLYETLHQPGNIRHGRDDVLERIDTLTTAASRLKQAVHSHFWVNDPRLYGGYFARGTDRDARGALHPLEIRSSDMGHLLNSLILDDDDPKIQSVIANLFSPDMLAVNGIRTLSSDSVRFHPDAYHNGSVWPWDTYTIALGLENHGYYGLARELERRIVCFYQTTKTLAEYGSGGSHPEINHTRQVTVFDPDLYPEPINQYSRYNIIQPPQEIQAWTVAAVAAIKHKNAKRARHPEHYQTHAIDPEKAALESTILSGL